MYLNSVNADFKPNDLIIIDEMMLQMGKSVDVTNMHTFTRWANHALCFVIFITPMSFKCLLATKRTLEAGKDRVLQTLLVTACKSKV